MPRPTELNYLPDQPFGTFDIEKLDWSHLMETLVQLQTGGTVDPSTVSSYSWLEMGVGAFIFGLLCVLGLVVWEGLTMISRYFWNKYRG